MKKAVKILGLSMIVVAMCIMTTNAQEKGDMAVGGSVSVGTGNDFTNIGIGAKFQYNILDPLRLEGSFTYFLKKDGLGMWDLSAYAHYLFKVGDKIAVYPLVGLGIMNFSSEEEDFDFDDFDVVTKTNTESKFATSFGGGVDFKLTDKLVFNVEAKYKIIESMNRLVLSAGIAYKF